MTAAMRQSLRNTVDNLISNGLSGSLQVPLWLTSLVNRTRATTLGLATYNLYESTKSIGVSSDNLIAIHNAFSNSYGLDIGRIVTTAWDSINNRILNGSAMASLSFAKGISQQASNLNHLDYTFDKFYGVWAGTFITELTQVVRIIELSPDEDFIPIIGYIDDLTTSCNGDWSGLGYSDLDEAVATLVPLISDEVTILISDTNPIILDPDISATTVGEALALSNTISSTLLTQYVTESLNVLNLSVIGQAMTNTQIIQNLGNNPRDPLFLLIRNSIKDDALTLFLQAPNLALSNSIMAPRPGETQADTFERVKKVAQLPTPTYSTLDILYKASAYDNSITDKYLKGDFDPRDKNKIINVFDRVAQDFNIDPCGGDRQLRQDLLKKHLDDLELELLKNRINDVVNMLTD